MFGSSVLNTAEDIKMKEQPELGFRHWQVTVHVHVCGAYTVQSAKGSLYSLVLHLKSKRHSGGAHKINNKGHYTF